LQTALQNWCGFWNWIFAERPAGRQIFWGRLWTRIWTTNGGRQTFRQQKRAAAQKTQEKKQEKKRTKSSENAPGVEDTRSDQTLLTLASLVNADSPSMQIMNTLVQLVKAELAG
jgi:hypothetical protein